jgi:hypothetical protein
MYVYWGGLVIWLWGVKMSSLARFFRREVVWYMYDSGTDHAGLEDCDHSRETLLPYSSLHKHRFAELNDYTRTNKVNAITGWG